MMVRRFPENPLITPADVKPSRDDFEVLSVFNPGVTKVDGEVLLLMRVAERPKCPDPTVVRVPVMDYEGESPSLEIREFPRSDPSADFHDPRVVFTPGNVYLTSISHFRIARSKDGRHFQIDDTPAIEPDRPSEAYGIEDARITLIDGVYYIVYKSVGPNGISQSLATTSDFRAFEKRGVILPPENMDAMIFPEKVRGNYAALHRPFPHYIGRPSMWIAYSDDVDHWGDHKFLAGTLAGGWEGGRIGGGAVPFMTDEGWLEIYHGATAGDHYSLGAMLLNEEYPEFIKARSKTPIMEPEAPYEMSGLVPNVVFACGAIVDGDDLTIYYGGADTVIAGAEVSVREILESLRE